MPRPAQKFPFPLMGQNTVVGYDEQPPGTTSDALNVRGFDALSERLRGGRRSGLSKWLSDRVNGSNGVQAMHPAILGAAYTSDLGSVVEIDDDFSLLSPLQPGPASGNYVYAYRLDVNSTINARQNVGIENTPGQSALAFNGGASTDYDIAALRWALETDKIEAYFDSTSEGDSANRGTVGNPFMRAVFLKMSNNLNTGIAATIIRGSSDTQVQLRIIDIGSSSTTTIVTSSDLTISDSATFTDSLYLSLELIGNTLTATMHWDDEYNGGAGDAGFNPAAPTTVTANIQTTGNGGDFSNDHTTNSRGGVGIMGQTNLTGAAEKWVHRVIARVYQPDPKGYVHSMRVGDVSPGARFFVPANLTSFYLDSSVPELDATVAGPASSLTRTGDYEKILVVDDDSAELVGDNVNSTPPDVIAVVPSDEPSSRYAVAFEQRLVGGLGAPYYVTRVSNDFQSMIQLELAHQTSGAYDALEQGTYSRSADSWIAYYVAGVGQTRVSFRPNHDIIVHYEDELVIVDDGSDITVEVNGMVLWTITPDSGEAAAVGDTKRTGISLPAGTGSVDMTGATWLQSVADADLPIASTADATLLVVAGGTVKKVVDDQLEPVINGDDVLTDQLFQVGMQSAFGKTYMVDGVRSLQYNQATNTVSTWAATAGTLPGNARLISLYRGRIVLAGDPGDPHNWFMSKSGDPDDWNYSPSTPSVLQAVAGNNSEAGLVGEPITALIPFSDDAMIIGAQNSIWQMTGDPAAGGAIDEVSDVTGIAFGEAWTKDPNGTLYFMGNDGIYRFQFGAKPENLTVGVLDRVFKQIDLDFNRVYLQWDHIRDGLIVMVVPTDSTQTNAAYFWEARTSAWWPDQYPASMGPSYLFAYNGPRVEDQALLFGCRDGYIRKIDDDAADDDGTAITSRVRFTPLISDDPNREIKLSEITPVLAANSGAVDLKVYAGQTAEQAATATTPRLTKSITAGRNGSLRQRVRGAVLSVELSQTGAARWALEKLSGLVAPVGKPRRHSR